MPPNPLLPREGGEAKGRLWRDFNGNLPPHERSGTSNTGGATFAIIAGLCLGLSPALCPAVSLAVAVDMTGLATQGAPPAPFSLDFQLVDGGGTATNTALLSHFDFGGGSATATDCISATCIDGANVSAPPLVISLTDDPSLGGDFLNEVILPFTPGGSGPLTFQLDLTTNLEMRVGVSPDAFTIAILDSSGFGIPTDFFDVFVQIDIT